MATFSERLKQLRNERGWSQDALAYNLGISRSAIGNYEQGQRLPDLETLEEMADIFNVDMAFITGKQEEKHSRRIPYYVEGTAEMIDLFSKINPEQRQAVVNLLRSMIYN